MGRNLNIFSPTGNWTLRTKI